MNAKTGKFRQFVVGATWWRWLVAAMVFFSLACVMPTLFSKAQLVPEARKQRAGDDGRSAANGGGQQKLQAPQTCGDKKGKALKKCALQLANELAAAKAAAKCSSEDTDSSCDLTKSPKIVWPATIATVGSGIASCLMAWFTYRRERREQEHHAIEVQQNRREQEQHSWRRYGYEQGVKREQREKEVHGITMKIKEIELAKLKRETQASENTEQDRRTQRSGNTKFRVV